MKAIHSIAVSLLSILAFTSTALAVNVVSMSVSKPAQARSQALLRPRRISARATIFESLANNETGGSYMADVMVGTPGQPISLVLDTGSSDVFVLANTADECTNPRIQSLYGGCTGGTCRSIPFLCNESNANLLFQSLRLNQAPSKP